MKNIYYARKYVRRHYNNKNIRSTADFAIEIYMHDFEEYEYILNSNDLAVYVRIF